MEMREYGAVLFDLDGVLTPTAEVHMQAWSDMFNAFLASRGAEADYTDEDYFRHVDGKPRYDGVRDFLASRGIELPFGTPGDAPELETICGLGNRKNDAFNAVLERDGIAPYPGSLALIEQLAAAAVPMAVVSSSKNAPAVLEAADLTDFFPVIVDGNVAHAENIAGKPAPDTYLRAAQLFGVDPDDAIVVEDAVSGVAAGAAGGFAHVVGVDRGVGRQELLDAGADVVVADLGELVR